MKQIHRNLSILLFLFGLQAQAQLSPAQGTAVKGKFFVSVDDEADIFINGTQLHHARLESESPETELKAGDRIVVKLKNIAAKRRFMILFLSTDRKQVISFTQNSFKILPDLAINDFTPAEFAGYKKHAVALQGDNTKIYPLPFKSSSKWIWGDLDLCNLGCLVTPELFKPNSRQ
jgi:hypothetical protein